MNCCFVALGSNLGDPLDQVTRAIAELDGLDAIDVIAVSSWYQSTAVGPGSQPDYINGVVKIETNLSPFELLRTLQRIEAGHDRKREVHWGPRTLDLDLLLYQDLSINTDDLTVPHPRMTQRNFVLYPLFEIAPDLRLPTGQLLRTLIDEFNAEGLSLVKADYSPTMRI